MPFVIVASTFPRSALPILGLVLSLSGCGPRAADWSEETHADIHRTHPLGVVGAVELVHVDQLAQTFLARIDTGATTSSIDAQDIEVFERDGEERHVSVSVSPIADDGLLGNRGGSSGGSSGSG